MKYSFHVKSLLMENSSRYFAGGKSDRMYGTRPGPFNIKGANEVIGIIV